MIKLLLIGFCLVGSSSFAQITPRVFSNLESLPQFLSERNKTQPTFIWIFGHLKSNGQILSFVSDWVDSNFGNRVLSECADRLTIGTGMLRRMDFTIVSGFSSVSKVDYILNMRPLLSKHAVVFFIDTQQAVSKTGHLLDPAIFENSFISKPKEPQRDLTSKSH